MAPVKKVAAAKKAPAKKAAPKKAPAKKVCQSPLQPLNLNQQIPRDGADGVQWECFVLIATCENRTLKRFHAPTCSTHLKRPSAALNDKTLL